VVEGVDPFGRCASDVLNAEVRVLPREDEDRLVRMSGARGSPRFALLVQWLGNAPWQWWESTSMLVMLVYVREEVERDLTRDWALV
jgi:hypothetical protein